MKRPSFQFYPADWRNNAKLRRCSEAARGAWMDVLCLMHDSDEYGVLRWPLSDIARATGLPIKLLKELADREVLKGSDKGCEAFYHIPIHARKEGKPVLLIDKTDKPCWYSSRFLVDEWRRKVKGANTRFGSDDDTPNTTPEDEPDDAPCHGKVKGKVKENDSPNHEPSARQGDGSTSTSTSSTTLSNVSENCNLVPKTQKTHTQIQVGLISQALQAIGLVPFNPSLPDFIAAIEAGATADEFANTALEFKGNASKFNFKYVLSVIVKRRQDVANGLHRGALPPSSSREAGRQVAAASIFTTENTQHLQGVQLKTINEVDHDKPAIAA